MSRRVAEVEDEAGIEISTAVETGTATVTVDPTARRTRSRRQEPFQRGCRHRRNVEELAQKFGCDASPWEKPTSTVRSAPTPTADARSRHVSTRSTLATSHGSSGSSSVSGVGGYHRSRNACGAKTERPWRESGSKRLIAPCAVAPRPWTTTRAARLAPAGAPAWSIDSVACEGLDPRSRPIAPLVGPRFTLVAIVDAGNRHRR
ncbi:hypothetical protein ACFQMM_20030 [Saliphagus sp. GCM10025308]